MFSISGAVGLSAIVAIAAGAVLCVVGLLLEGIVLVGLPGSGAWRLGCWVGIITFGGVALIAIALQARTIDPSPVVGESRIAPH